MIAIRFVNKINKPAQQRALVCIFYEQTMDTKIHFQVSFSVDPSIVQCPSSTAISYDGMKNG